MIEIPSYNSQDLAEKIGVTKRTIERTFKILQEKKRIERIGSKRDGNWIVTK
ncbi:HTH domain-containing protein [Fusobacterium necrophorum]|uniref:HTH domain-containing protein n=1 Tax=Fusobacterium necrophorum TaxID=859 RepID=UPI00256A38D1|nr:HTH domain-containing protein [Fusobacterium necrophorum]